MREFGLNAIHRLNNIGLRLFENDYYHRLIGSGPPGLARILHASNHAADRTELDGAAHLLSEDEILIIVHLEQLIIAIDGKRSLLVIQTALGHVHIDLPEHGANVFHAHPGGCQRRGIHLHANRFLGRPRDIDLAHAFDLAEALADNRVTIIIDLHRGHGV